MGGVNLSNESVVGPTGYRILQKPLCKENFDSEKSIGGAWPSDTVFFLFYSGS